MSDNSFNNNNRFWVPLCGNCTGCASCSMEAVCSSKNVTSRPKTTADHSESINSGSNEYDLKEWMKTIR